MLFLVFRLGSDRYAIEATQVVEVLPLVNWRCVPRAAVGVAGIIDYHGVPVPLIDLMELALGKPSRKWMSTRIILVNYRQDSSSQPRVLGLMAEQATETMRRPEADFVDSGLTVAESPYLGSLTTGLAGTIQRVEIKHLLPESIRSQLFLDHAESEAEVMAQMDFEALLKETIGLDPGSVGSSTVDHAVRRRMAHTGMARLEDYWQQLRSSKDELQELIEMVVVPETWFFRDQDAFTVFVRLAREEWLPTHGTAVLRALSVPCSTGEEPYSMVIALLEGGFSREQIKVDAVDVSARALARARLGEYGLNSFRSEDLDFRERYFRRTASGYSLAEWLPGMVTFRQGNLLSPELGFGQEPYDVIFCRNLLIYFDRSTQERIMGTLESLLTSAGFLFVGGSETYLASRSGFTSVNRAMSFAFRKTGVKRVEPMDSPLPLNRPPGVRTINPRPSYPVKGLLQAAVPSCPVQMPPDLGTARSLADAGRLREAAEWCERHLCQQNPSPETYYLLGIVRDAMGDGQGASECYRKLLYLDPEHEEALTHLALLSERQGDIAEAGRLRERVRRIESRAEPGIS